MGRTGTKTHEILIVPGFMADTYSEIEKSFVELSERSSGGVSFVWLVPDKKSKFLQYKDPANSSKLDEPLFVSHLRKKNIPYIQGNISKYNLVSNYILFSRVFRGRSIAAVYTHFGFERFWATFFGKVFRKTTIWNEHWYSLGTRFVFFKRIFYKIFVDYFISVSQFITDTLPSGSRVYTIHNAIEAVGENEYTQADKDSLKEKLCLPKDKRTILMVAAFRPEKRHHLALTICMEVLRGRSDVQFVFLGDGAGRCEFINGCKRLGIINNVSVPGHVLNTKNYYIVADACMLTSHEEPFGYAVLEAMNYKKPIVTFASGGPKEIITNGIDGILVPDGDVAKFSSMVLRLLDNGEYCRELGKNAFTKIQNTYSRSAWIERLGSVMFEITGYK